MASISTEEENKKKQPDKVELTTTRTTTHGDRTATTKYGPSSTTRTDRRVSGFVNEDGTPNEAANAEFEEGKNRLAAANHINPETGHVDKRYLFDILGYHPKERQAQREEEKALNNRKAKEKAWTAALAAMSQMVMTAAGGNAWKLNMPHPNGEHEANLALQREQWAEDDAMAKKKQALEQSYAAQVQKLHDSVGKAYQTKVVDTDKSGRETTRTSSQGNDVTTTVREEQQRGLNGTGARSSASASASGGSGSRNQPSVVKVRKKDGTTAELHIPSKEYTASGKYISSLYNALIASGNDNIAKVLEDSGIYPQKDGTYKAEDLLSSGIVFDNPQVRAEFVKIIKADTTLTDDEKQQIVRELQLYPALVNEPQKKSWLSRLKERFVGKKSKDDANIPPYKRNQAQANQDNVPPYKRK